MRLTTELLELVGSPFALAKSYNPDSDRSMELLRYSSKNRMLFLYLQAAYSRGVKEVQPLYQKENARRLEINDAIIRASNLLTEVAVDHVVFKTIRPYQSTTVDIDILVLGSRSFFRKSVQSMKKDGYQLIVNGPKSTTLWDRKASIGVDIYDAVAVSYITYIDKNLLVDYATTTKIDGRQVSVLKPEADLACIIAHSMIKEQMYTLSEYYSYLYYLKDMNIPSFLNIVRDNHIVTAARTHTAITSLLHLIAHKTIPKGLRKISAELGEERFETSNISRRMYGTPYKYHPLTITRSIFELAKGKASRSSIPLQLVHMLNPYISKDFLKKFTDHLHRETY